MKSGRTMEKGRKMFINQDSRTKPRKTMVERKRKWRKDTWRSVRKSTVAWGFLGNPYFIVIK